MTLFRLDASIRTDGSVSREIADLVEQSWRDGNPDEPIVRRHVGTEPIPATYWAAAVFAPYTPTEKLTDEQKAATALAATLVDELVSADALLFAVPLYNFGVSQHFKAYIDLLSTDPRMGPAAGAILKDKPTELVTVRGGSYAPGTPRDGWDHSTSWIRRILEEVWQVNLSVVETEFTLAGVNPALDEFKELGAQLRAESDDLARLHGALLAS
ncbi:MAG: FMN-dependent NADH-azoreductase [Frankiales bacterium]|jgi:FMN-dependent NADH-azoreductase|nr:FMN-dependent NADH-azoreductase [Frankiales bacterium]